MNFQNILSLVVFLVFLTLAAIHLYWVLGGKWGLSVAFPTKVNGERLMEFNDSLKSQIPTFVVALGLTAFGLIALELGHWINIFGTWDRPLGYAVAAIFAWRAVGEFNYLGLFKKVKNTPFAQKDSRLYVPLCLFLSITLIALCQS